MKKMKLYFLFYKAKFLPPLVLALFALLKFKIMPLAVIALITATLLIWFYQRFINDRKKQNMYFYYNLGLTELKLYTFVIFINLTILIGTNIYIK
jgi:hypothetical protein